MYLAGANSEAAAEGLEPLAARSHYLRGKDPSEWQTDVPHFGRVRYQDVYRRDPTDGSWRIAKRHLHLVWQQDLPQEL